MSTPTTEEQEALVAAIGDFDADIKKVDQILSNYPSGACDNIVVTVAWPDKGTLLHLASFKGHKNIVRALVEKYGANVNVQDPALNTPLHSACLRGNTEVAQTLLELGADLNSKSRANRTPLQCALDFGHTQLAGVLSGDTPTGAVAPVAEGSSASPTAGVDIPTEEEQEALEAVIRDNTAGMEELDRILSKYPKGACDQISITVAWPSKGTPLHLAGITANKEAVRALVEKHGANLNIQDSSLNTPLHLACLQDDPEVVNLLLELGANPALKSKANYTPLDIAKSMGNSSITQLLSSNK